MGRGGWLLVLLAAGGSALLTASLSWLGGPGPGAPAGAPAEPPSLELRRLRGENERLRRELAEARAAARGSDPGSPFAPAAPPAAGPGRGGPLLPRGAPPEPVPADAAARVQAAVQGLRKACEEGDAPGIERHVQALARLGPAAAGALIDVLRDAGEGEALRVQALALLRGIGSAALASVLAEILVDGRSGPGLRAQAVAAASLFPRDPTLARAVREIAQDPSAPEAVRRPALGALVVTQPAEALGVVRRLLASPDARDRDAAVAALGSARDRSFLPVLTEVANSPQPPPNIHPILNAIASIKDKPWSAFQATGEPDTPLDGDLGTAWAPKQQDMGEVWLELDYPRAVIPEAVRIHETLNPGAVVRVLGKAGESSWETLWEGTAPEATSPCWFEPTLLRGSSPTRTIRVVLDTNRIGGWNEIDAVELLGGGERQWASAARASSSYSDN